MDGKVVKEETSENEIYKIEILMQQAKITTADRRVTVAAKKHAEKTGKQNRTVCVGGQPRDEKHLQDRKIRIRGCTMEYPMIDKKRTAKRIQFFMYCSEYTEHAIRMLIDAGVKTNIHYVLSKETLAEAVERLATHTFPKNLNAIVFLLHKPVGLEKPENMITRRYLYGFRRI